MTSQNNKPYTRKRKLEALRRLLDRYLKKWGYSEKVARVIGCENLTKPNIQAALQKTQQKQARGALKQNSADVEYVKLAKQAVILTASGQYQEALCKRVELDDKYPNREWQDQVSELQERKQPK